ncbi:hypothetical protein I316_03122 [Kwoniella heveanensis BCC8398]|uniref:Major facilitator superfamily (MFS) profile domain-containing protein n=1 Tax=Kwoniella heveanensis BCC8398 TaxID=1296120 RepID=A0A1B9GVN9_9TREE|nr:hypothetical protein I316_03122 [Kwoniella heveanensis BCC8398]
MASSDKNQEAAEIGLDVAAAEGVGLFRAPASHTKDEHTLLSRDLKDIASPEVTILEETYDYPEGGYGWVVVGCCMTFAALTMGWGVSWGVFQAHYAEHSFPGQTTTLTIIGAMFGVFQNTAAFIFGRIGDKFGFKRILFASAFVAWLGLFLASWSTKLWQIILTQGVLTGIGMGIGQPVYFSLPSQWFHRRRGLASGLAVGGAGFGGAFGSLIIRALLKAVGVRKTLLIYSFINLTLMIIATLLIRTRPNSPEARAKGKGPWVDKRVWTLLPFHLIALCLLLNTFGYSNVTFFVTQYVNKIDHPKTDILGALAGIGRISIGFAADLIGAMNAMILVCLLSSLFTFTLWLTATTYARVLAFAVLYGLIAPTYYSLVPMSAAEIFGSENLASNIGVCLLFTGPGGLGGGLVGGAILSHTGEWKWTIIYGALVQAVAGVAVLASTAHTLPVL